MLNKLNLAIVTTLAPAAVMALPAAASYEKFEPTKAEVKAVASTIAAKCPAKAGGPKYQLNCRDALITQSDARLNTRYKRTMARLKAPRKTELRDQERAWILTRYDECNLLLEGVDYPAPGRKGEDYEIEAKDCIITENNRRTLWLDRYK